MKGNQSMKTLASAVVGSAIALGLAAPALAASPAPMSHPMAGMHHPMAASAPMTKDQMRDKMMRVYTEVWNAHHPEKIAEFVTSDFVDYAGPKPTHGPAAAV